MTRHHRADPDPVRPLPEAANLGIARPPLVYLGSILLGVFLQFAWPISLLSPRVSPLLGALVALLAIAYFCPPFAPSEPPARPSRAISPQLQS
jgi:hypothetical protein